MGLMLLCLAVWGQLCMASEDETGGRHACTADLRYESLAVWGQLGPAKTGLGPGGLLSMAG